MKLDAGQVFGASERLQPVTEAPASVSFITAEEIARYGYRTLADILRGVRGMYVTDDRNFSFIGTRGFAKPGDYNSRILLLVNGHRVNDNIFGQAEIGAEFGLDPAMFERVEIIRGPASSLYGDSAFFAVVNVITRTGASLGGALGHGRGRHAGDPAGAGQRRAPPRERRGRGAVGHLRAQRRRRPALLSGVRYAGHQQRRGRGARWRRRQAVLRPPDLQGPDRDRRLWHPAARRADRLVRHAVQSAGLARADDRSSHAGRCGLRALVRRHAPDVPRLLRSVLLRRDLSVCRRAGRHADRWSDASAGSGRGGASAAG